MGFLKLFLIVIVVLFIIAAMAKWFPEESKQILHLIYQAGIQIVKLAFEFLKKLIISVWDWLGTYE